MYILISFLIYSLCTLMDRRRPFIIHESMTNKNNSNINDKGHYTTNNGRFRSWKYKLIHFRERVIKIWEQDEESRSWKKKKGITFLSLFLPNLSLSLLFVETNIRKKSMQLLLWVFREVSREVNLPVGVTNSWRSIYTKSLRRLRRHKPQDRSRDNSLYSEF